MTAGVRQTSSRLGIWDKLTVLLCNLQLLYSYERTYSSEKQNFTGSKYPFMHPHKTSVTERIFQVITFASSFTSLSSTLDDSVISLTSGSLMPCINWMCFSSISRLVKVRLESGQCLYEHRAGMQRYKCCAQKAMYYSERMWANK